MALDTIVQRLKELLVPRGSLDDLYIKGYRVNMLKEIGRGGFGTVYEATYPGRGNVAAKKLCLTTEECKQNMKSNINIMKSCRFTNFEGTTTI